MAAPVRVQEFLRHCALIVGCGELTTIRRWWEKATDAQREEWLRQSVDSGLRNDKWTGLKWYDLPEAVRGNLRRVAGRKLAGMRS